MTRRVLLPLAALAVLFASPVLAQQPTSAQTSAIRQSCRSDYQANCSGVPTGGRAALSCLQQHAANLSPACQQAVAAVSGGGPAAPAPAAPAQPHAAAPHPRGGLREACRGDVRALCRGERPGGGRLLMCLKEHQASLSPGCAEALGAMRQGR